MNFNLLPYFRQKHTSQNVTVNISQSVCRQLYASFLGDRYMCSILFSIALGPIFLQTSSILFKNSALLATGLLE